MTPRVTRLKACQLRLGGALFGFAQPSCHFVKADDQSRTKWQADYVLCHLWQATDEMPPMPMPHRDPLEGLIGGTQIASRLPAARAADSFTVVLETAPFLTALVM